MTYPSKHIRDARAAKVTVTMGKVKRTAKTYLPETVTTIKPEIVGAPPKGPSGQRRRGNMAINRALYGNKSIGGKAIGWTN